MYRLIKLDDSNYKYLRGWRNANKKYFVFQGEISKGEHDHWYKKYKEKTNDLCYVICEGEIPIGTVSLVIKHNTGTIERVMLGNSAQQGKGIMTWAMEYLMDAFSLTRYELEVLKNNERAINFYKKLGFEIIRDEDKVYIMQKNYE